MWTKRAWEIYNLGLASKVYLRNNYHEGSWSILAKLEGEHVELHRAANEAEARDYMEKLLLRLNGKGRR